MRFPRVLPLAAAAVIALAACTKDKTATPGATTSPVVVDGSQVAPTTTPETSTSSATPSLPPVPTGTAPPTQSPAPPTVSPTPPTPPPTATPTAPADYVTLEQGLPPGRFVFRAPGGRLFMTWKGDLVDVGDADPDTLSVAPGGNLFAYVKPGTGSDGGTLEVVADPTGARLELPGYGGSFAWQPGQMSAAVSLVDETNPSASAIYLVNLETGDKTPLTKAKSRHDVVGWTAAGSLLVVEWDAAGTRLFALDPAGGPATSIELPQAGLDQFILSPGGGHLAMLGGVYGAFTLWIAGVDGSNPVQVFGQPPATPTPGQTPTGTPSPTETVTPIPTPTPPGSASRPIVEWLPSGDGLLFDVLATGRVRSLHLGALDGTDTTLLENVDREVALSPGGETIVARDLGGDGPRLVTFAVADPTTVAPLFKKGSPLFAPQDKPVPTWAPDGSKIGVRAGRKLYVCEPDGSQCRQIGTLNFSASLAAWLP